MKIITIIATSEGADHLIGLLNEMDEDGELDFPFSCHATDDINEDTAHEIWTGAVQGWMA